MIRLEVMDKEPTTNPPKALPRSRGRRAFDSVDSVDSVDAVEPSIPTSAAGCVRRPGSSGPCRRDPPDAARAVGNASSLHRSATAGSLG